LTQINPKNVTANERGVIRIYGIDLPADQIQLFAERPRTGSDDPWPLHASLGATADLNEDSIEIIDVEALGEIGLAGYLTLGNGVTAADVEPYRDLLAGVQGHVAIVFSSAFKGVAQTLSPAPAPAPPLRFVAAFREEGVPVTFEALPDDSAKGTLSDAPRKKPVSDAAMSGRVATIALLVMALLVWLMIKIAG
jgi:hypothetical protein